MEAAERARRGVLGDAGERAMARRVLRGRPALDTERGLVRIDERARRLLPLGLERPEHRRDGIVVAALEHEARLTGEAIAVVEDDAELALSVDPCRLRERARLPGRSNLPGMTEHVVRQARRARDEHDATFAGRGPAKLHAHRSSTVRGHVHRLRSNLFFRCDEPRFERRGTVGRRLDGGMDGGVGAVAHDHVGLDDVALHPARAAVDTQREREVARDVCGRGRGTEPVWNAHERDTPRRLAAAERNGDPHTALGIGAQRRRPVRIAVADAGASATDAVTDRTHAAEPDAACASAAARAAPAEAQAAGAEAQRAAGEILEELLPGGDRRLRHDHVPLGVDELVLLHRARIRRSGAHHALEGIAHVVGGADHAVRPGGVQLEAVDGAEERRGGGTVAAHVLDGAAPRVQQLIVGERSVADEPPEERIRIFEDRLVGIERLRGAKGADRREHGEQLEPGHAPRHHIEGNLRIDGDEIAEDQLLAAGRRGRRIHRLGDEREQLRVHDPAAILLAARVDEQLRILGGLEDRALERVEDLGESPLQLLRYARAGIVRGADLLASFAATEESATDRVRGRFALEHRGAALAVDPDLAAEPRARIERGDVGATAAERVDDDRRHDAG